MFPQSTKGFILPFEYRTGRSKAQIGSDLLESKTLVVIIPEDLRLIFREVFVNDRPDAFCFFTFFLLFLYQNVQWVLALWVLFVTEPFQ